MHVEQTVIGHPSQRQLVAFAETLVDRNAPVSALLAAHVANCPSCAREVKQIRASFAVAALAQLSVPPVPHELTRRIVARAHQERNKRARSSGNIVAAAKHAAQIAACCAGAIALAYFSFGMALNDMPRESAATSRSDLSVAEITPDYETLKQQTATARALATAVSLQQQEGATAPHIMEGRRLLDALDEDISAALAALERNPGLARANQVMANSVEKQLEDLRSLYLDRKL